MLAAALLALLAMLANPGQADATNIPGTISTNTTWNAAGNPYLTTGNVSVASNATLTIGAGVIIKIGTNHTFTVNGILDANGAEESPILFTSAKDDAPEAGGDTNGDGSATFPAAGQWGAIRIRKTGSSFEHVEIRYGGVGSGGFYQYGAVNVTGGDTTFYRVSIHDNAYSGIRVSDIDPDDAQVTVDESSIVENGNGISTLGAPIYVFQSQIARNEGDGLWFSLQPSYSGRPASTVINNKIASNGDDGVYLQVQTGVSTASFPYGYHNNILNNNTDNPSNQPRQLYSLYGNRPDADWSNNYWGVPEEGPVREFECQWTPAGQNPWHLTYGEDGIVVGLSSVVPPGPINFTSHYTVEGDVFKCGSDAVQGHPFSPVPFKVHIFDFEAMTSSEEENAALSYYRPYLYFDQEEDWQPVTPESFIDEAHAGTPFHDVCLAPGSCFKTQSLGDLEDFYYVDVRQLGEDPKIVFSPRTLAGQPCEGSVYWDCMGEPYSKLLYNRTVVDSADGVDSLRSYWDYWWFFRYNKYTPILSCDDVYACHHEGDWEGMTVVTLAEEDGDSGPADVLWVSFAQHDFVFRYTPGVVEWTQLHPRGFAADGTHATYPYTCSSNCWQDGHSLPEGHHDGTLAWQQNLSCSSCVEAFPETSEAMEDPTVWPADGLAGWNALDFTWGADESSPQNPGEQGRFKEPWVVETGPEFSPLQLMESGEPPPRTIDEADCASWFGPGIVAAVCDEAAMQRALDRNTFGLVDGSVSIRTSAAKTTDSTAGLAQALGARALRSGEKIELVGNVTPDAELQLRVAVDSDEVALTEFDLNRMSGTFTVSVTEKAGRTSVQLVRPGGRVIRPTSLIVVEER